MTTMDEKLEHIMRGLDVDNPDTIIILGAVLGTIVSRQSHGKGTGVWVSHLRTAMESVKEGAMQERAALGAH
jgi:hypothetical protein